MLQRLIGLVDDIGLSATKIQLAASRELPGLLDDIALRLDDVVDEGNFISRIASRGGDEAADASIDASGFAARVRGIGDDLGGRSPFAISTDDAALGARELGDELDTWATSTRDRLVRSDRVADDLYTPGLVDDAYAPSVIDDAYSPGSSSWADDQLRRDQELLALTTFDDWSTPAYSTFDDVATPSFIDDGFGLFG